MIIKRFQVVAFLQNDKGARTMLDMKDFDHKPTDDELDEFGESLDFPFCYLRVDELACEFRNKRYIRLSGGETK